MQEGVEHLEQQREEGKVVRVESQYVCQAVTQPAEPGPAAQRQHEQIAAQRAPHRGSDVHPRLLGVEHVQGGQGQKQRGEQRYQRVKQLTGQRPGDGHGPYAEQDG